MDLSIPYDSYIRGVHYWISVRALRVLVIISSAMGFLPFSRSSHDGALHRSTARIAWTVISCLREVTAAAALVTFTILHRPYRENNVEVISVTYIMKCLLSFRIFVSLLAIVPPAFWAFPSWDALSRNLANIDHHYVPEDDLAVAKRRRWMWCQLLAMGIALSAQSFFASQAWPEPRYIQAIRAIAHVNITLLGLQYINIALILKDKFAKLNESLSGKDIGARQAMHLRSAHLRLCDATEQINCVYGWSILGFLCFMWIHITMNLHYILRPNSFYGGGGTLAAHISLGLFVIREALAVVTLCAACDAAVAQARRTRRVLDHMLAVDSFASASISVSFSTAETLEGFRRQVTSSDIHFSAGGILHVDLPLLSAFFGALVAYLIVLLQVST